MRRLSVIGIALALAFSGLTSFLVLEPPAAVSAAPPAPATTLRFGKCPANAEPLPAEAIARAADQARIEAPELYKGYGGAVVELAWQAKLRLDVWVGTPIPCNNQVRNRTIVVDLFFPKMLPSASLSEGAVLVSLFPTGYQVWEVAH